MKATACQGLIFEQIFGCKALGYVYLGQPFGSESGICLRIFRGTSEGKGRCTGSLISDQGCTWYVMRSRSGHANRVYRHNVECMKGLVNISFINKDK
jgi:hypothetical protein